MRQGTPPKEAVRKTGDVPSGAFLRESVRARASVCGLLLHSAESPRSHRSHIDCKRLVLARHRIGLEQVKRYHLSGR